MRAVVIAVLALDGLAVTAVVDDRLDLPVRLRGKVLLALRADRWLGWLGRLARRPGVVVAEGAHAFLVLWMIPLQPGCDSS